MKNNPAVEEAVNALFKDKPEARQFLCHWVALCHAIDDIVDEAKDVRYIKDVSALTAGMYNCAYWQKHSNALYLVERLIDHTYFDSVEWESAIERWKRVDAKCLSHCGYNMIFAVILLEFGEAELRKWSNKIREFAHIAHSEDKI